MWRKNIVIVTRTIKNCSNLRSLRHLHAASSESYIQHPGSEPLTHATLSEVLAETANRHPNRVALRSVHEDITLTYDQLLTKADALGCALRAQGLEKGDRLGLWSHNSAAWVVALIAAVRAGLITVLINPVYEIAELRFCLKKTGVKSLLIGENLPTRNYYKMLQQLIPRLGDFKPGHIVSETFPELISVVSATKEKINGTFSYDTLVTDYARQDISKYSKQIKPEDGCILHLTSGTTGDPKAGLDSHYGLVNNTYFIGKRKTLHERHHNVCIQTPLFHALGSIVTLLAGFRHGSTITLAAPTYNVDANVNALYAEKCTVITGTPTMFIDMLPKVKAQSSPPPKLEVALAAGAPYSPQLIRDMQTYFNVQHVMGLYGLTEATAGIFQSLPGDSVEMVAETVGYIHDHIEIKVVDEEGRTVPYGVAGELMSRGYSNMIGYWDEPEKTKKTISEDGWLSTGDKFTISPDGYGRIVGRIKDIIVRGGENIAPKEIEDLLNTHPDIIDSQVVGIPDDRLGEELCAVLRLKPGSTVTLKEVTDHLTGKLARFKIPRVLKYLEEFPKTTSGKVQKFKIVDMIKSGKL